MTVLLKLVNEPDIPVEADVITPNQFAGKSVREIRKMPVYQGNKTLMLDEFFEVSGKTASTPDETKIEIEGNLRRVKYIGHKMNGGKIEIRGDVGMYLGSQMQAGRIHVHGSVGEWAATEMSGGNIQIEGDAGDFLCAGLRGSVEGMKGGRVYVAGEVGREMASHMRRGFIAVKGNVGEMAAARMQGGTIIVMGNISTRVGVQATRGMILILGTIEKVIPTFRFSGISQREFTTYYLRYLKKRRSDFIEEYSAEDRWLKFQGDFAEGRPFAEIYVLEKNNESIVKEVSSL